LQDINDMLSTNFQNIFIFIRNEYQTCFKDDILNVYILNIIKIKFQQYFQREFFDIVFVISFISDFVTNNFNNGEFQIIYCLYR
jgi:hypothetical protein